MFDIKRLTPDQAYEMVTDEPYNSVREAADIAREYPDFLKDRGAMSDLEINRNLVKIFETGTPNHDLLRKYFGQSAEEELGALQKQYEELKPHAQEILDGFHAQATTVLEKTLEAKKKIFATQEGRDTILKGYDENLTRIHDRDYRFIEGAKLTRNEFVRDAKDFSIVSKLMQTKFASPEAFVRALEGGKSTEGLNEMVKQAIELSYIQDKTLGEAMKERLIKFIPQAQADVYAKLASEFENGTHHAYLAQLQQQHGPEVERLKLVAEDFYANERAAATTAKAAAATSPVVDSVTPAAEGAGSAGGTKASTASTAEAGHSATPPPTPPKANGAATAAEGAEEAVSWIKRIPGGKWTVGGVAAAAVAGIGWAAFHKKRTEEPSSPQQQQK